MSLRLDSQTVSPFVNSLSSETDESLIVNVGMQSFTYAEYTTGALAKVWNNQARLPSTSEMWRLHEQVVKERGGYGKYFQYLGATRVEGDHI